MNTSTLKIITWNVNGIRAAYKKGALEELINIEKPHILFFNEIKGTVDKFPPHIVSPPNYHAHYHSAQKPGYAGTGVWVRKCNELAPKEFLNGLDGREDTEGRVTQLKLTAHGKPLHLLGCYFPNGGKSPAAFDDKLVFYEDFLTTVNRIRKSGEVCIWTGDVNCAHQEIDLARPKENENSIGFLPVERAWVSKIVQQGWADVFRAKNPTTAEYTWWNLQTRSRERNVGWRIDYFFLPETLLKKVSRIEHLTQQMGSDHCPVVLHYEV